MHVVLEITESIGNLYFFLFVSMRLKVKALNWEQSTDVDLGLGHFIVYSEAQVE